MLNDEAGRIHFVDRGRLTELIGLPLCLYQYGDLHFVVTLPD